MKFNEDISWSRTMRVLRFYLLVKAMPVTVPWMLTEDTGQRALLLTLRAC